LSIIKNLLVVVMLLGLTAGVVPSVCAEPVTISYMYSASTQEAEDRTKMIIEIFEAANPDIKVERLRVTSAMRDKMVAMIGTDTLPDVVSLDINYIMEFGDERILLDLNPFLQKSSVLRNHRITPVLMEAYQLDGKQFAIPNTANPSGYFCHAELFNSAGLMRPTDLYKRNNWTWESFEIAAKRLTTATSDGRLETIGAWLHLPRTWIYANGGMEVDDVKKPTRILYDAPQSLEALRFLHRLTVESKVMAFSTSSLRNAIGISDHVAAFTQGKLAMSSRWISYLPQHALTNSDVDVVPYPRSLGEGGRYATDIGPWGLSVSSKSKNPDAAFRLIEFLTGLEGQKIRAAQPGGSSVWPINISWLPENVTNPEIYPDLLMAGTLRIVNQERQGLQSVIDKNLSSLWKGDIPVEIAVRQIMEQAEQFLVK